MTMYQQIVRPQLKVSAHKFLESTKSNNEITTGKALAEIVISCLIWWDESSDCPRCHSTGNSQFLFTVTWRPLKRLQIGGLDKLPQSLNHGRRCRASLKVPPPVVPGINLFICYHIRVRLHFPRFARTRPVVLCNGSLRDPNVQTGIPGDRSTFSPASSTFLLLFDLLFWECAWFHLLSPHLHQSLPF